MAEEKAAARLAVLIDAENVPQWAVTPLLTEIARHGTPQVRRAYGDWTSAALHGRKQTLLTHAIRPVQVFAAVKGKNAADIAVVIDAMDLLHSGTVDAFHLVSRTATSRGSRNASARRDAPSTATASSTRRTRAWSPPATPSSSSRHSPRCRQPPPLWPRLSLPNRPRRPARPPRLPSLHRTARNALLRQRQPRRRAQAGQPRRPDDRGPLARFRRRRRRRHPAPPRRRPPRE